MNASNTYCQIADVQDVLSNQGVELRTDDCPPTEYGNAIARAGDKVDWHCFRRYTPDNLALSPLVRDWAAVLAAYYLSCRRGNDPPAGIAILYEEAIANMTEVKKGLNEIPGIPARKSYVPVFSSMRATQRPFNRSVVEKERGSHATGSPENFHQWGDIWDTYGWNSPAFLDYSM